MLFKMTKNLNINSKKKQIKNMKIYFKKIYF